MERSLLRQVLRPSADDILYDLTMRQHLKPHRSIGGALSDAASRLGYCLSAAERALGWLQIDPATSIGRLRRCQLTQLSQSIQRFGRPTAAPYAIRSAELSFVPQLLDDGTQQPGLG